MCGWAGGWIFCTFMSIINTNRACLIISFTFIFMKLRVARHTTDLQPLIEFYTKIIGLEIIGEFKNHNNYDGVFIGNKDTAWELEFTVSNREPNHHQDEEDLLVFYPSSDEEYNAIKGNIVNHGIEQLVPKSPYWKENGITIADPDGFRIVIALSGV